MKPEPSWLQSAHEYLPRARQRLNPPGSTIHLLDQAVAEYDAQHALLHEVHKELRELCERLISRQPDGKNVHWECDLCGYETAIKAIAMHEDGCLIARIERQLHETRIREHGRPELPDVPRKT